MDDASKTTEAAEWEGYINGLIRAGNMRPGIPFGDDGGRVLNAIRAQIDAEIDRAKAKMEACNGR